MQREKGVSQHLYDFNKLRALLSALQEEAKCILLFLRSVRSVQVTEISGSGMHSHVLKVSIRETSSDQLGHKRHQFQRSLERLFNAQSYGIRENLSLVVCVQVEVNDYQDATRNSTSKWLVANQVGTQSSEARKVANELKVFPWVGVALETSLEQVEHGGGRVFCVLPMPLEVSCNLPVHVNGTFSLNDERRELKWQSVERKNDQSAQWNHLLVTQLLPPCYASLLLDHAKMLLQPKQFCKAWPNTRKVRGTHWEGLLTPLLSALFAQQVIPFCKPGSLGIMSWTKVSSATFVPRGSSLPTAVTTALIACGVKLVTVPDAVWNALEHCKIAVTPVSASLTRSRLKESPHSYSGFTSQDKLRLLQYCLNDNAYGDLYNLALLPLANGTFANFQGQFSNSVYLCSSQCPRYLLPNLDGELVDNDIENQLYLKLKAIAESGYTNLKVLATNYVAMLLPRSMPQEWQYQNIIAMPHSTFNVQWFERFWRWVAGETLHLFSDQFVIPVFNSQTQMHSITRLSQKSPSLFIPSTQICDPSFLSAVEKLGVKCCLQRTYPFIQHISYLSKLMHYFSSNGIVDAITCASPSFSSISLTKEEARQLRTQVHSVSVSTPRQATLRNLPMFLTLGNTGEKLYSVTQVEHSTSRITQMEPLNFPLSADNLPSSVILFSSSDYYQRMLLQSLSVQYTTTVDLLMNIVFPLIEVGSMGRNLAKVLMEEVLINFDVINSHTPSDKRKRLKLSIAKLPFLPVSAGKPKAPNTLFSPSDTELKNLYYQQPIFPVEPFASGRILVVLKSCGLKTKASSQEIVDIILSICLPATANPVAVDEVQHKRAKAVLTYISRWSSQLSETVCLPGYSAYHRQRSLRFSEALLELSQTKCWLPVQTSPPSDYPSCLTWKGSGNSCHLVSYGSSVLLSGNQSSLALACGSQIFFIDHSLQPDICSVFKLEAEKMVGHVMAHLEEVILSCSQFSSVEQVRKTTQVIYKLLHNYQRNGCSASLSMLRETEDCVWLSKQKRFVHPHDIALEQNASFRHNLEPFIYILPDDLNEFASLFEHLGVQPVATKPQILGILEKIKDGNSQSLGVSNRQAWQLVMSILNWLTDNGEHMMDESDSESIFVPVEPDTEWPTLVKCDDIVYTDNAFLQRFLESSGHADKKYTFVNYRVSSQLAHQLRLTPLSKYLNISEDAFEDVGQNEPLTVRLKNILKNYKDGLTIIKELLQNADDAGASEMNVCYDTRHHEQKHESLFFPGMADCHGPALVVHNNARFTKEDFQNITKLAGATKEGKVLKIGKFGVGFCSVYHITDIPSFVSDDLLYVFDPTLTHLKDEIRNPALPGKKVRFTSSLISQSKQLAPYVDLFGFDPQCRYMGTTFRFPFRKTASELSGKIYRDNDVTELMEQVQNSSSKLLIFLQNIKSITISRIDCGQESPMQLIKITTTSETLGSGCIRQVTCSVSGSPATTEYWLVETCTQTVLQKYSIASVACALHPLPDSGEQRYIAKQIEGEMFCFLPLSVKTGLPVHVSSNFAVSNNRTGIWTSDESLGRSDEVQWNEALMKGVIPSAYSELLERLKEMVSDSKLDEYEFFSMWPLKSKLKVYNPWHLCVAAVYEDIKTKELFFSAPTGNWLTLEESKFLDSNILKVSFNTPLPSAVLDIVNHLQLPVVHLPEEYHYQLDLSTSTETEKAFLEHFFCTIDELETIIESRNAVLCLALECYANELDRKYEDRFCYLHELLTGNACIPSEPDAELLRKPDELIHPGAGFAKLYDTDENRFPLKTFCDKKLVEKAMKELGMLHVTIPLHCLEERARGIAAIYEQDPSKAMDRVKLIIECLLNEDKHERYTAERCTTIAGIAFLPVLPKPDDYPLPWKGKDKLYSGAEIVLKGAQLFQIREDYTNLNIAGSQAVFLNQNLPCNGGCGFISTRVQEILQIRRTPSCMEVLSHFQILIDMFDGTPNMVKWADRISRKVYEYLDKLLKEESKVEEATDISALSQKTCIWTGEKFVECSVVAKQWTCKGPYLYKVPDSIAIRKHLQTALNIKESFSTESFVSALQSIQKDFTSTPLPGNCQALVREIVPKLPSEDVDEYYGQVMLPDTAFKMHEARELFFNDMPWKPQDDDYTFVHKMVPLATAKAFGVQLCRSASLERYSVAGSQFMVMEFGQHEELTRRIQNIIRDYPFDMTILKELLQNADDAKASKMHVILDMRKHNSEHLPSDTWEDLQGPALLVWNDSVFSESDLKGIQRLGLGSKRSDSETIGQYGIGFNAVYHLTDCPSFLTGGNTLCILDPHMRYVPQATDRHPGAMYANLDDKFWNTFDGIKSTYLRDDVTNRPKELLGGSLFRFPLRHTLALVKESNIVNDLEGQSIDRVISSQKMREFLKDWAPQMKQSLLFLNNVMELKFSVIRDRRGVLELLNSYKTELNKDALKSRSELVQKIREFANVETRDPHIATYPLTIVESLMKGGKDRREEWLIQQGIGDSQKKVEVWTYVEQVKPRHGIAAPLKRDTSPFKGQVFCFLPLPLYSELPVHINGHFILNSTRRNLWTSTDPERLDDKSRWNENLLQAIVSSYAQFLERITEYFATEDGRTSRASLERCVKDYYICFPKTPSKVSSGSDRVSLSEPWLQLVRQVYCTMAERNSPVLAVPTNASLRSSEDKYLMQWQPLRNEALPASQVHFWKNAGEDKIRSILERIGMKITCAPLWIMKHFVEAKCKIPDISRSSVFDFYTAFSTRFISDHFPRNIEDTPFKSVKDFKLFTEFLLEQQPICVPYMFGSVSRPQSKFPNEPFGYPLLLTADNQLRVFDHANRVLCSRHAKLFPKCPNRFLHEDFIGLSYSLSYFVSVNDDKTVSAAIVKEVLESVLPGELKNMYLSAESEAIRQVDIKGIWKCFGEDEVFKSVLDEVLKVWALLLTRDNRLFRCGSTEQLLPIIPPKTENSSDSSLLAFTTSYVSLSVILDLKLKAPFLDTAVIPVDSVKLLCPQFSNPKAMLKNLYYLQREFPFSDIITVDSCRKLLSYFASIHFREDVHCCQTIKYLPLFETIDGVLTPLIGRKVFVWPDKICQAGSENWLRGTDVVFLKPYAAWSKLGVARELGVHKISAEEAYVKFVFPKFFKLSKEQRYSHLKHIRVYLFETNLVATRNRKSDVYLSACSFVSGVKTLQCIGEDESPLQPVSHFYTHKKVIFTTFPKHFQTLPNDFMGREESSWMTFFLNVGLQEKVTQQVFLTLCNDVANGKLKENTRTASGVLLDYLFSPEESELHGFHRELHFLKKVSDIAFLCPVPLPELEWIHKVPSTTNRVILTKEEIPLCKLSGSCLSRSKELVWTVLPIVAVTAQTEHRVLQGLEINVEPHIRDVVNNIKILSKTPFADPQQFMKYTCLQRKKDQKSLIIVMSKIFEFLISHLTQVNISELRDIPCIPVHAFGNDAQLPVLVEPYRVVFWDATKMRPFYPFIHGLPNSLYFAKELLDRLGVKDSLQLKHMQIVLESMSVMSGGMELEPNSLNTVSHAVKQLDSFLKQNKTERSQMGEEALAEVLDPLYLSGTDKQMHHVESLVYCTSRIPDLDLSATRYHLVWTPIKFDIFPERFCELLPKALQPKPLSQLCVKKISSSCKICEKTTSATNIEKTLQIPNLSQAMCIVVKHIAGSIGSPSVRERICSEFEEHLVGFLQSLEIHCVEHLTIDIFIKDSDRRTPIASQHVWCFIQEEESSYHLYLDSNARDMYINEAHECVVDFIVPSLKETDLNELQTLQLQKFLQRLLRATSPDDVYNFLQEKAISCSELNHAINYDNLEPKLGDPIPKSLHFRLDLSNNNIFQPQEWVGYQPTPTEECYIFAQISHPVCLKDASGQSLKPMHIEYIIFTSEDDEDGKKVKAMDLYKFIRGSKAPAESDLPVDPECQELVPYEGDTDDTYPQREINLQQVKEEIRKELQDIWQLSKEDRRRAIHRLYLKWHPDKNLDNPQIAEEVFKFIQEELDRLEKGDRVSSSFTGRSWRTYKNTWDHTARQHRHYSQQYHQSTSYASSQSGADSDDEQGSGTAHSHHYQHQQRSGGGGSCGGFFSGNFSPPTNIHEARRWVRQAVVDCKALEALLTEAQSDNELASHVCFMAHEVAEKALKSGMYATCGLGDNSLKSHNIYPLGRAIEAVSPEKASGLADLTFPLEPYYLDTRFPNRCSIPSIPSDNFTLTDAEAAAECARGVLKKVRDVITCDLFV